MSHIYSEQDHYAVLNITESFPTEDIAGLRRTLAKRYHPDSKIAPDPARFKQINDACDVLGDPEKRRAFDRRRAQRRADAAGRAEAEQTAAAQAAAREARAPSADQASRMGDAFRSRHAAPRPNPSSRASSGSHTPPPPSRPSRPPSPQPASSRRTPTRSTQTQANKDPVIIIGLTIISVALLGFIFGWRVGVVNSSDTYRYSVVLTPIGVMAATVCTLGALVVVHLPGDGTRRNGGVWWVALVFLAAFTFALGFNVTHHFREQTTTAYSSSYLSASLVRNVEAGVPAQYTPQQISL